MSDLEIIRTILTQFPYALMGSMLAGLLCAYLGVYVVSRRVVFVGMTLTEIAVAGVAFAHLVHEELHPTLGSFVLTFLAVIVFTRVLQSRLVPRDSVLGASYILAVTLRILMMQKTGGAEMAEPCLAAAMAAPASRSGCISTGSFDSTPPRWAPSRATRRLPRASPQPNAPNSTPRATPARFNPTFGAAPP